MNPSSSLFQQANQFILGETKVFDFFDYLAGQKLQIDQDKPLSEKVKITFRHVDTLPKKLYLNRKLDSKDQQFKPIFLKQVSDELQQDTYPTQQLDKLDFNNKQLPYSVEKRSDSNKLLKKHPIHFNSTMTTHRNNNILLNSLSTNRNKPTLRTNTLNTSNS